MFPPTSRVNAGFGWLTPRTAVVRVLAIVSVLGGQVGRRQCSGDGGVLNAERRGRQGAGVGISDERGIVQQLARLAREDRRVGKALPGGEQRQIVEDGLSAEVRGALHAGCVLVEIVGEHEVRAVGGVRHRGVGRAPVGAVLQQEPLGRTAAGVFQQDGLPHVLVQGDRARHGGRGRAREGPGTHEPVGPDPEGGAILVGQAHRVGAGAGRVHVSADACGVAVRQGPECEIGEAEGGDLLLHDRMGQESGREGLTDCGNRVGIREALVVPSQQQAPEHVVADHSGCRKVPADREVGSDGQARDRSRPRHREICGGERGCRHVRSDGPICVHDLH